MRKEKRRFTVRPARSSDLEALVDHRRGMWEDMGIGSAHELDAADKAYKHWVKGRLKTGKLVAWIAEDSHRRIVGGGCLWLRPSQPHPKRRGLIQPYLLSMYTEPDFRGNGVASRIVSESIRWAKAKGFPLVWLHASRFSRGLYSKRGFKPTREMSLPI